MTQGDLVLRALSALAGALVLVVVVAAVLRRVDDVAFRGAARTAPVAPAGAPTLPSAALAEKNNALESAPARTTFAYTFNDPGVLNESAEGETPSPYWWLDSGGELVIEHGVGETVQGDTPASDRWRKAYAASNPRDTDLGAHPQNLFRLVSRGSWDESDVEASFFIVKDELSKSPNRNVSNGLLLMSRYANQYNLYYAGVRADGDAVIKKKYHGAYYTMAERNVFPGAYDRESAPNLIPHGEWLSLKSETETAPDGSVSIALFMRREGDENWTELLFAKDDGVRFGGAPLSAAHIGIRTDFMDVEFRDIRVVGVAVGNS